MKVVLVIEPFNVQFVFNFRPVNTAFLNLYDKDLERRNRRLYFANVTSFITSINNERFHGMLLGF